MTQHVPRAGYQRVDNSGKPSAYHICSYWSRRINGFKKKMHLFSRTAITKHHQPGTLIRNAMSHDSGGWKYETKVLAGLVPSETVRGESV